METYISKGSKISKRISKNVSKNVSKNLDKTNLVCMKSTNYIIIIGLIILFIIVLGFCLYKLYISPHYVYINQQPSNNNLPSNYNLSSSSSSSSNGTNLKSNGDIQDMVANAKMTGIPALPIIPSMPRIIGNPPLQPLLRPETLPWIQPVRPNLYDRRVDFALVGYISRKHNLMMPLYGRMTRFNSNKYEYYVIDTTTNIKIPVYSKNDNELYTNDEIFVNEKRYKVIIYDMNEIRY